MAWTAERKINCYLDLIQQAWGNKPIGDALRDCVTLGLTATGATFDVLNRLTYTDTAVTAFETFFALASINMMYTGAARSTTNGTITAYAGASPFGNALKD